MYGADRNSETKGRAGQYHLHAPQDRRATLVQKGAQHSFFRRSQVAKLYLKFGDAIIKEVPLAQHAATIGRLPDNTLQIDNLAVSGHHAKISFNDGRYVLEDLGSLNGTYVNNKRVGQATLIHGDQVLIGKHVLEFKNEGAMALGVSQPKAGP